MVKPSENPFIGQRWSDTLFQTDKGLALVSTIVDEDEMELNEDARTCLFLLLAALRSALTAAGDQVETVRKNAETTQASPDQDAPPAGIDSEGGCHD